MSRLILVRHGNTFEKEETCVQIGSRTDLPLTSFGKEKIQELAQNLEKKGVFPDAFFSGPLRRQKESAEILASHFHTHYEIVSCLSEIDYGAWEGLSREQIQEKWPKESAEWTKDSKWQSTIFQKNFEYHFSLLQTWLKTLSSQNKTIVAVTSGGIIRLLNKEKIKTAHMCELSLQNGFSQLPFSKA